MYTFFGIHWQQSHLVIGAPILIFLLWFIIRRRASLVTNMGRLVADAHRKRLFPHFSFARQKLKTVLLSLTLISLFLALLQPAWGRKEQVIQQEGRDVLVLLDISRSMLAEDVKPNRLEFSKLKIRNLLSKLDIERLGLILFSGSAFVQCPLTVDHDAFLMFLDQVDVETIASGTTAIDTALAKAMEVFAKSEGRKNKLIILITDGEDFSLNLHYVKRHAQEQKVTLFTLGVGTTEGAPIPIYGANGMKLGLEKDQSGTIAMSRLNEQTLTNLGKELSGVYVKSTYGDNDIDHIARLIRQFEKEKFGDKKVSSYEERYPWLIGTAWVFLVLEWIL